MAATNGSNGDGRGLDGRFRKGNKGGPGNPRIRHLRQLQRAVREAATPKQIKAVLAKLQEKAEAGDIQAAKVYLERTLGKPKEMPEALHLDITKDSSLEEVLRGLLAHVLTGQILPSDAGQLVRVVEILDQSGKLDALTEAEDLEPDRSFL